MTIQINLNLSTATLLNSHLSLLRAIIRITLCINVRAFVIVILTLILILIILVATSTRRFLRFLEVRNRQRILQRALRSSRPTLTPLNIITSVCITILVRLMNMNNGRNIRIRNVILPPFRSRISIRVAPETRLNDNIMTRTRVGHVGRTRLLRTIILVPPFRLRIITRDRKGIAALTLTQRTMRNVLV